MRIVIKYTAGCLTVKEHFTNSKAYLSSYDVLARFRVLVRGSVFAFFSRETAHSMRQTDCVYLPVSICLSVRLSISICPSISVFHPSFLPFSSVSSAQSVFKCCHVSVSTGICIFTFIMYKYKATSLHLRPCEWITITMGNPAGDYNYRIGQWQEARYEAIRMRVQ
jgi:hypothetical protein